MYYTIISCSPQNTNRSTSSLIAKVVKSALTKDGRHAADIFCLNDRSKWNICMEAFYKGENLIFVLPLYVEGLPGIMLEFLQTADPEKKETGNMAFILQGGFEEASQLRTCEEYLSKIPAYFNCTYAGTLVKGGMFGMATMRGERFREKACEGFASVIAEYAEANHFSQEKTRWFTGDEYYSKGMIMLAKITHPLNLLVWNIIGKKMGINGAITTRPYKFYG